MKIMSELYLRFNKYTMYLNGHYCFHIMWKTTLSYHRYASDEYPSTGTQIYFVKLREFVMQEKKITRNNKLKK